VARLCVTLTETTGQGMLDALRRLPGYVDLAEVRLDHLARNTGRPAVEALETICAGRDRPVIVTNRTRREGGLFDGPESERLALLRRAGELGAEYVDVELDSVAALGSLPGSTRRIVSYHNFDETPPDLDAIHQKAVSCGADVVKITVLARDVADAPPVLALLRRRAGEVSTIALSMGEEGIATRVLAGKFGAFLSFASAASGHESAEGQVPHDVMESMYRFSRIGPATDVYGVVANPVAHSMSPAIHNAAFAQAGLDAVYLPFKVASPRTFLEGYEPLDLRGLSVTIPHKEATASLMDELDDISARIGAINTVTIRRGRRLGSNTDVAAAMGSLREAARRAQMPSLSPCRVLLLGAGGAGRALAYALAGGVKELVIANRTVSRARRLAAEVGARSCGLDQVGSVRPDVVVNTTSVGMHPRVDESPVPASVLQKGMVVLDAVYNPIETLMLRQAREAGCVCASGFEWFVGQAAVQFETWTGAAAPKEVMARVVRQHLSGG